MATHQADTLMKGHSSKKALPYTMISHEEKECASFLVNLKNRSVTPEPLDDAMEAGTKYYDENDSDFEEQHKPSRTPPLNPEVVLSPHTEPVGDDDIAASLEVIVRDSTLVNMNDRDLVPDALFVAMAQMQPCGLTESDRVGCYKGREIGFLGMCCKHCGGQPGFGKYFPASVRSLAQTTTSQTILKHIGLKCRHCPIIIRQAVQALQEKDTEQMAQGDRPRYGSRKVFFQRVWGRLHGQAIPEIPDSVKRISHDLVDDRLVKSVSSVAATASVRAQSDTEDSQGGQTGNSQVAFASRSRYVLPTRNNKRKNDERVNPEDLKRQKFLYYN